MHYVKKQRIVFSEHAVQRIVQRRVPISAISLIAQVGITVQRTHNRVMKRGEVGGLPVHLVIHEPTNTLISVYFADEWVSTITLERKKRNRKHVVTRVYA